MNKTAKNWLIAAVILVASGFLIFIGAMAAINFDFTKLSTWEYETNTYEVDENFNNISIDVNITDVVFEKSNDESCKIVCYEAKQMKHSVSCSNGTLTIGVTDKRNWYDYISITFESPKMTVYLPESKYDLVMIEVDTGNIDIPKNFTFNELDLETHTGNIKCTANVSEIMEIESNTGSININSVGSSCNINAKTNTGSLKLEDITCSELTAENDTGDIYLGNVITAERISAITDTGDVNLKSSDAADIFLESDTGDITGTLRSGKIFTAQSSMGDVDVPDSSSGGKCKVTTDTGDIKIELE